MTDEPLHPLVQMEVLRREAMKNWGLCDLWALKDACKLLVGSIPDDTPDRVFLERWKGTQYETIVACASLAIYAKTLKPYDPAELGKLWPYQMVKPRDFLIWAKNKGFDIPKELLPILELDGAEQNHADKIIPLAEPRNKDDWFYVIRDAIRAFESEKCCTPSAAKLWAILVKTPPADYGITFDAKRKTLVMPDGQILDRETFNKRYGRYYPAN